MSSDVRDLEGAANPYVVIGGFGRSGSNLVLNIFDVHEMTHCRNEPNDLARAAMTGLTAFFHDDLPADFAAAWPRAIATVASSVGDRDNLPARNKLFLNTGPAASITAWVQSHSRVRHMIGLRNEWPCPPVLYDRDRLDQALPVLKMMLVGAGLIKAHSIAPGQRLVHILRSPAGFLNSWYNRYVLKRPGGEDEVWKANLTTLPRILAHFDEDPARFERQNRELLLESELWRWRYLNEMLYSLAESDRYHLLTYEAVTRDPVSSARTLFAFAGLDFSRHHMDRINAIENRVFAAPHQVTLDRREIDAAATRVLTGSPLASLV